MHLLHKCTSRDASLPRIITPLANRKKINEGRAETTPSNHSLYEEQDNEENGSPVELQLGVRPDG